MPESRQYLSYVKLDFGCSDVGSEGACACRYLHEFADPTDNIVYSSCEQYMMVKKVEGNLCAGLYLPTTSDSSVMQLFCVFMT